MARVDDAGDPRGRGALRGGTAIQEDPDRPAFRGNGPDDYVCVQCGNVLAEAMDAEQMTEEGARALRALPDRQRLGDRRARPSLRKH